MLSITMYLISISFALCSSDEVYLPLLSRFHVTKVLMFYTIDDGRHLVSTYSAHTLCNILLLCSILQFQELATPPVRPSLKLLTCKIICLCFYNSVKICKSLQEIDIEISIEIEY